MITVKKKNILLEIDHILHIELLSTSIVNVVDVSEIIFVINA
jgi:hypothetical protein